MQKAISKRNFVQNLPEECILLWPIKSQEVLVYIFDKMRKQITENFKQRLSFPLPFDGK